MFRTFLISSRRLLIPRPFPALTPDVPTLESTTIYDIRRNSNGKEYHQPLPSFANRLQPHPLLGQRTVWTGQSMRLASGKKEFQMPNPTEIVCNMINMLKCVDLNDAKDAPPPSFWIVVLSGVFYLGIPFLEVVGGYSPFMTLLQLNAAAVSVGYCGGKKWGMALSNNPVPTLSWDTMRWSLLPGAIAITGLMLPYPLGFLTIALGMITSLYLDLKSCVYPPWAIALTLCKTVAMVIGLLLSMVAYILFHNREKKKKEVKAKKEKEEEREEEEDEGEDGDNDKKQP